MVMTFGGDCSCSFQCCRQCCQFAASAAVWLSLFWVACWLFLSWCGGEAVTGAEADDFLRLDEDWGWLDVPKLLLQQQQPLPWILEDQLDNIVGHGP